ncbi:hypothetical protein B0I33_1106 [Prauserella shujinwangii]|uniref:Scramblase n=1 Tax=Prauserella shujinwangii TaxID=1453103 RepID=A0A2T0LNU8_9PSEU|nr:hypothetical protein [Prauserella shujinwangii]PRX44908.1 hypothetical protein B0I33_1106 [Prauserella shujinwangii]
MDLFSAATLHIEHPGGFRNALWRTEYRVDVYDEHGTPLAVVREREGPGALKLVRATGFSGHTPFDLRVTLPDGRDTLGIEKGFSARSTRVAVTDGAGKPLGSLHARGPRDIAVSDVDGRELGTLSELAAFQAGALSRRDGRRVRRDLLRLHRELAAPARQLAIAAAVAFDIVHNKGTTKPSGWSWPAG